MKCPPQQQGVPVQPEAKTRRKSEWPRIQTSHTRAETPVEQMNVDTHTVQNISIMDFKSMLMNHLACQGITPPKLRSKSSPSREVSSLSTKLVEGDTGLMGPKHNSGLPDRLLLDSTSTCNTSLSTILCRADSPDFRGGNRVTTEGSNRGSSTCRADRFLFEPLSGPKEGWRTTPSNKSQSPKQLSIVNKEHFKMEGIHTLKDL